MTIIINNAHWDKITTNKLELNNKESWKGRRQVLSWKNGTAQDNIYKEELIGKRYTYSWMKTS